jgi:hypothetical protein
MNFGTITKLTIIPGTHQAQAAGCTCPVMDNNHGDGWMGLKDVYVFNTECPVHSELIKQANSESAPKQP